MSIVEDAKAEFNRAKQRIITALEKTPDEKINWSPSSTARTPVELVTHSAFGIKFIQGMLQGEPFPFENLADFDASQREEEKQFTTREASFVILEANSKAYINWLDTLSDEEVNSMVTLPFGPMPMAAAITLPADHTRGHSAQLEYLHTIWGDRNWYM